jgi:hypothetical protein
MRAHLLTTGAALTAAAFVLTAASPAAADNWNTGTSGWITSNPGTQVGIGNTAPSPTVQLDVLNTITNGRTAIRVNQANTAQSIADFQRNATSKLKIDSSGRTGIANSSPAAQLDVASNASGQIGLIVNQQQTNANIAEFRQGGAMKVSISSTGILQADAGVKIKTWSMEVPDYVFDSGHYKLRGLDDLERFIQAEQHLPDLPSAAQLKEEGMDLAEMNLRLLKKVEELTLYAIQQDKKIKELAAKIDDNSRGAQRRAQRANLTAAVTH